MADLGRNSRIRKKDETKKISLKTYAYQKNV